MARKLSAELRIDVKTLNVKALDQLANKLAQLSRGQIGGRGIQGGSAANVNASVERGARAAERAIRVQMNSAQMAQKQKEAHERWSMRMQLNSASMASRQAAADAKRTAALRTQKKELSGVEREMQRILRTQERTQATALARTRLGITNPIPMSPVEREIARFKALEERRTAREQARKQLGMGAPGGFLQGHGFTSKARAALGALRDITVAGYGAHAAIYGIGRATEPLREYQTHLAEVKNKGQFGGADMAAIEKLVRNMGRTTSFGANQSLGAAVELAAAGVGAHEMGTALPSTLRFAQGSGLSTAQSGGLLVQTASQLGLGADQFERIGDVMTKAANMSTIAVADIGESLNYVGPVARTAGLDLEFVAGTIALLGENGLKGSMGGTALRRMLTSLVHPTKRAKEALAGIGMSSKDLAAGIGSPQAFMNLFRKMNAQMTKKGTSTAQRMELNKLVFGEEGITAADILTRASVDQSAKGWEQYAEQVKNAKGAMKAAGDEIGGTLNGRIDAMKARWETATITLTEQYLPAMEKVVSAMSSMGNATADNPWITDALLGLGGVALGTKVATSLAGALLTAESMTLLTAAGATLGATIAGGLAAGITGYGLGTVIAKVIGLPSLEDQERRSSGQRGLSRADQQEQNGQGATSRFGWTGRGPLSNEAWDEARGGAPGEQVITQQLGATQAPFTGALEISINSEGRPRIEKITSSDGRLSIGANVSHAR